MSWPVEIDGREYQPVPRSWVEHGRDDGVGRPRLYAVSAAVFGRQILSVRYVHPRSHGVLHAEMRGVKGPKGGIVPEMLATHGTWPRSLTPGDAGPDDAAREPEIDRLCELWNDRITDPSAADERVAADGGERA